MVARAGRRVLRSAGRSALYGRWPAAAAPTDGYTVLMPLPGDLPAFLELALAGFARQDPSGRREMLVIPDRLTPAFADAYRRALGRHSCGPVRLVPIPRRGRLAQRLSGHPYLTHFLQLYHGMAAATTTHALLHDADLFIGDPEFAARRYRHAVARDLACLGVAPVFDDFYERHALGPVLATWELLFDLRWIREFPPWQIHGHTNSVAGLVHEFDTMDYPQVRTPRHRRELLEAPDSFVHFSWVITVYRFFQRAGGRPYEDDRFLILLIRLLTDAVVGDDARAAADLPSVAELARGITDPGARVTYRSRGIAGKYVEFRRLLGKVTAGPLIDAAADEALWRSLEPFDAAFGQG